jgi:hypothetical protein
MITDEIIEIEATVEACIPMFELVYLYDNERRKYSFNKNTPNVDITTVKEGQRFKIEVQIYNAASKVLRVIEKLPDESISWKIKNRIKFHSTFFLLRIRIRISKSKDFFLRSKI